MGRGKRKRCTCTAVWLCQSMRPINGNRREALVLDPECPVHKDDTTPTETEP